MLARVDPAQAYDYFGWEIICNIGSTLIDIEPGSQAGPGDIISTLATSWSVSPNGLNWTLDLREGVLFDDGTTKFNATHVKYSFERALNIASPDGPQVNMGYSDIIDSVEVTNKYQVKFNLHMPSSPFLQLMACQASSIVNPQYAPCEIARAQKIVEPNYPRVRRNKPGH